MSKKEQIQALRAEGKTYNEITEELGCSKGLVSHHCQKLPANDLITERNTIDRYPPLRIPIDVRGTVLTFIKEGIRKTDIAEVFGLEYSEVVRCQKVFKIKCKTTNGLSSYEKVKRRRKHIKMLAVAYLGGSCSKCNYFQSLRALTFHHKDPKHKDFGISRALNRSWKKTKGELDKCELLCANCHAELHEKLDAGDLWEDQIFF